MWEDTRRGNEDPALRRSVDGGATWGPVALLVRSDFDESDPVVALDGNVALLGWVDRRHGGSDIVYRRSTGAGLPGARCHSWCGQRSWSRTPRWRWMT